MRNSGEGRCLEGLFTLDKRPPLKHSLATASRCVINAPRSIKCLGCVACQNMLIILGRRDSARKSDKREEVKQLEVLYDCWTRIRAVHHFECSYSQKNKLWQYFACEMSVMPSRFCDLSSHKSYDSLELAAAFGLFIVTAGIL